MRVTVSLERDMHFVARGPSGHHLPLDTAPEAGGTDSGARPMEMLLSALGGCTGMNVISILRKMRIPVDHFEVRLTGERQEEHPKAFTAIHLEYVVRGKGLSDKLPQIERAVQLSHDKYCSVAATLSDRVALSHRIVLEESGSETL